MFRRTVSFFYNQIMSSTINKLRVVGATLIDLVTTTVNIAPVIILSAKLDEEDENESNEMLHTAIFLIGSSMFLGRILPKLRNMLLAPVAANVQNSLSMDMLSKCFELELDQHLSTRTGEFAKGLSSNYTTVDKLIPSFLGEVLPFSIDTIGLTVSFGVFYKELAAFPPSILVLYFTLASCIGRWSAKARKQNSEVGYRAYGSLLQAISTYQVAHQFGNVVHELQKVKPVMLQSEQLHCKTQQLDNLNALLQTLVNYAGLAGTIFYVSYKFNNGLLSGYDFAAIAYLMFYFATRLESFTPALNTLLTAYTDSQKIIEFHDRVSSVSDVKGAQDLNVMQPPSIHFENVCFSYRVRGQVKQVLNGINFVINPGDAVAIVGETGAGKSTIIQLLQRFYHCDSGRILVNGSDITTVSASSLRDLIAVVSQDANLFHGTVEENIRYGYISESESSLRESAINAGYIKNLEETERLNTNVGEKGKKLSGGEMQRVSIARALLKGGLLLLLDEPTSALDPQTEKYVQDKLNEISGGATTLVVTHKLYTLTQVDQIYYLEGGLLVEQGTFAELLNYRGKFYQQLQVQCGELGIGIDDIHYQLNQSERERKGHKEFETEFSITTNWHKHRQQLFSLPTHEYVPQDCSVNTNMKSPLLRVGPNYGTSY